MELWAPYEWPGLINWVTGVIAFCRSYFTPVITMVFGPTLSTLHQGPFIAGRFWRWKIQRHGLKTGRGPPCSFCSHFPAKFRFLLEYPSALSQAPVPPIELLLCGVSRPKWPFDSLFNRKFCRFVLPV